MHICTLCSMNPQSPKMFLCPTNNGNDYVLGMTYVGFMSRTGESRFHRMAALSIVSISF